MKSFLSIALVLLPAVAQAQTQDFVVRGTVSAPAAVTRVYLGHAFNKQWVTDSATVKNGHFEFRGTLPEPVRASLTFGHNGIPARKSQDTMRELFYLEKGIVEVVTRDSAAKATVRGTPINDDNTRLRAALKPLNDQQDALQKESRPRPGATRTDPAYAKQLEARLAAIGAEQNKMQADYVRAHPDAPFSLFVLYDLLTGDFGVAPCAALFQGLSANLRGTPRGQRIAEQIRRMQTVDVGVMAPDFTLNTPDNVPVTLSSLRGQYVLLDFWASWCGPCRQENPNVVRAYNTFKDKGFTVLGVSLENPNGREAWVRAIAKDGLPWTQVSDLKSMDNAVARAYSVQSIPQNFLLDPQGKIVAINLRGEALQSTLAKLLNKAN